MLLSYRLILWVNMLLLGAILPLKAQKIDSETTRQQGTQLIISLFDKLVAKNILGISHLKSLLEYNTLINPIEEPEAHASHETFIYKKQLDTIIANDKHALVDLSCIHDWARVKINELGQQEIIREEVHEKTKSIYRPMAFIAIPAGRYKSSLDESTIIIEHGIEIQETPVTRHQWEQVMAIHGAQIADNPDAAITSINFNQIKEFLTKLNKNDIHYIYGLPSVDEYDALLQATRGKNWLDHAKSFTSSKYQNQECSAALENYIEHKNKRIGDVIGTLWQWTRDKADSDVPNKFIDRTFHGRIFHWIKKKMNLNKKAHIVFGGSCVTKKESLITMPALLRPILCAESKSNHVGLRLMRSKKNSNFHPAIKNYTKNALSWNETFAHSDDWMTTSFQSIVLVDDVMNHDSHYTCTIE